VRAHYICQRIRYRLHYTCQGSRVWQEEDIACVLANVTAEGIWLFRIRAWTTRPDQGVPQMERGSVSSLLTCAVCGTSTGGRAAGSKQRLLASQPAGGAWMWFASALGRCNGQRGGCVPGPCHAASRAHCSASRGNRGRGCGTSTLPLTRYGSANLQDSRGMAESCCCWSCLWSCSSSLPDHTQMGGKRQLRTKYVRCRCAGRYGHDARCKGRAGQLHLLA
jgi:hypothetical protein